MNILIVDDQRSARRILSSILTRVDGLVLHEADSLETARDLLGREAIDVALVDIRLDEDMRNRDGLTLVREVRSRGAVPIVVSVSTEMVEIRTAMRMGAYDYIFKDELCDELVIPIVEGLQRNLRLEQEVRGLRARVAAGPFPIGMIGTSRAMNNLRETIQRVAMSDRPVLVTGPTGAGKELVVNAIHALGAAPQDPILDLNCGAIPETLIESQLFGHERGAFTGADHRQEGYFTAVRQGTLFLDEIGELPLSLQAKLLRVLETGRFRPLGSTTESRCAGRVVAATHADLEGRLTDGRFREDLYYRLNVLQIAVPSLDERREDIPSLVAHFAKDQRRSLRFTSAALDALMNADWPGNVRQLRNLIDRLAVFCESDEVTPESMRLLGATVETPAPASALQALARSVLGMDCANKLDAAEDALIAEAMVVADGNKSAAARLLGVHRKAVERRLEKQDAEPEVG